MQQHPGNAHHAPIGRSAEPGLPEGPQREALSLALKALEQAQRHWQPVDMALAYSQVARAYRGLQLHEQAESQLEQALRWACCTGAADPEVRVLCELTDVASEVAEGLRETDELAAQAAMQRMREHALSAAQRATQVCDPEWEIKVLLRVSDVLNRCGAHEDACTLQGRAMRLMVGDASVPGASSAEDASRLRND